MSQLQCAIYGNIVAYCWCRHLHNMYLHMYIYFKTSPIKIFFLFYVLSYELKTRRLILGTDLPNKHFSYYKKSILRLGIIKNVFIKIARSQSSIQNNIINSKN